MTNDSAETEDVEISPERLKHFTWEESDIVILEQPDEPKDEK